ncbi:MAG TPA: amino acid permease [Candidatus Rubrimentiphilum sp.]|nr:amino acid permease [Candidatus Rubrimentiphilum sp.]
MIRGIGLRSGVAINVITMVGIGPLITIPLVLAQLAGPLALIGWIAGAIVALCDGLVWAELSSRYPGSGGTYVYLREIFGRDRWGRLLAFLFNWQFLLFAPCLLATGYLGFAIYFGYLVPGIGASHTAQVWTAIAVGVLTIALLYRRITTVAKIGSVFAVIAIGTLLLVMSAAFWHSYIPHAFTLSGHTGLGAGFLAGLGGALYITLYDYTGYSDAALLGDEVRNPHRTIPLAIVFSIVIVAILYVALQIGVLAHGVPAGNPQFIASSIVAESWGPTAARIVTGLILVTAFASVYGNLVGFARIPYAAAKDGEFFRPFAHLDSRGHFPDVALLVIGAAALVACIFELGNVIAILTAGIVLIQGVMQIVGLFVLRSRGERAPFRMWLYPLPALVALCGWLYAFYYTGTLAIVLGVGWLVIGILAYLVTARVQRRWPFAILACLAILALTPAHANAGAWPGSAIVQRNGYPIYTVGGKPFFVYGAAFFYERIPRPLWEASLAQYRAMGINTIDLYVMWNWHELRDGDFDFNGRTNPRRDLAGLLRLIDRDGFKVILRPGPVIRNEWRNGGYPDWLLRRPEYNMPLRDILEGRYPATATLQNQHSDDAAAEWMNNSVHMRYATRWLQTVLHAVEPWQRDVIAIALDDDQGAYLDNQTWPAPHFQRYIKYLASVTRGVAGSHVPLFINTYDMKVTPSAPVWAWGNWYQSDAYSIGEHDRAQLEFSTGLIATQPHLPVMVSEFQAGWLQDADQAWPRPADPANTTLALNTLLQSGAHGVVNFPVQDTLNPPGWEAPWANAFYSWDAALSVQLTHQGRWLPTQRFGELIHKYGPLLAQMHVKADAAIAYLTSAYDASALTNDDVFAIAKATMDAQHDCRAARITCALVDLRFAPLSDLQRYPVLIVPPGPRSLAFTHGVQLKLEAYRAHGGHTAADVAAANISHPAAGGIPNAVLLVEPAERFGFLNVVNYENLPARIQQRFVHADRMRAAIRAISVAPRDAALIPVNLPAGAYPPNRPITRLKQTPLPRGVHLPLRPGSWLYSVIPAGFSDTGVTLQYYGGDSYLDEYLSFDMENAFLRLVVSPCAGARAFILQDKRTGDNLFTTIGAFRDTWSQVSPPSNRDYIARYTHPIATGTFNRCYSFKPNAGMPTSIDFDYSAPDAPPNGAAFKKTVQLYPRVPFFTVKTFARFAATTSQRAQQLSSIAIAPETQILTAANGYGFYEAKKQRLFEVAWPSIDVEKHQLDRHPQDALLTLTFAPGETREVRFGVEPAHGVAQAQAALAAFAKLPPLPTR